jgi:hypothetical protein
MVTSRKTSAAGKITPIVVPQGPTVVEINNPYEAAGRSWLKGEIHAHVCKAKNSSTSYEDGVPSNTIYAGAADAGLNFVCMSVDVTWGNGGPNRFGDVGSGTEHGVIGIPGREIQNNYFYPEIFDHDYFTESGADYLHVLTIGEGGLSICLHPTYYDLVKGKPGGRWSDIKSALLHADAHSTLGELRVSGIEIYNGFTMRRLQDKGCEHKYSGYDEYCWDELLTEGRLCWGFCGNDSFFHSSNDLGSFSPLGVTYASAQQDSGAAEIVESLRRGCFYASTGVRLAEEPIVVTVLGSDIHVVANASTAVNWTARILRRVGRGWTLTSHHVPNIDRAEFQVGSDWKYVRVQCESVSDPWQRAWLQPITNKAYYQ